LIDDGPVHEDLLHALRDVGDRSIPYSENNLTVVRKIRAIAGLARGQGEFGSAFGDLDCISGKVAGFVVKRSLETREEQFLKHEPGLPEIGMAFDIGQTVDIEMRGKER
jgi:hypothetical protein